MRIGLFTDTYRPSINGIVTVIDITKKHLESMGHEVYIFCPAVSIRPSRVKADIAENVIRFPSMKAPIMYDDYDLSFFLPPQALGKIRDLEIDIIHFFTPSQIGILGIYAAHKTGAILVGQHSTDIYEYIEHYPSVIPGFFALGMTVPFATKVRGKDIRQLLKLYRPRRHLLKWSHEMIEHLMTMVYKRCDIVIALSKKSQKQLMSWQNGDRYEVSLLPTGVDALPKATKKQAEDFRARWNIDERDEVVTYVGRLGSEKNLALLIPAIEKIVKSRPRARLLYVGDFEYRETLEEMAAQSTVADRITFTGSLPRESLGEVYRASDVFVFPSLTDTQGLVLHEAAHAGLPIVLIDEGVSEVFIDGENGLLAKNNAASVAKQVATILGSPKQKAAFGEVSKKLARKYTESAQTKRLESLYKSAIRQRNKRLNEELPRR